MKIGYVGTKIFEIPTVFHLAKKNIQQKTERGKCNDIVYIIYCLEFSHSGFPHLQDKKKRLQFQKKNSVVLFPTFINTIAGRITFYQSLLVDLHLLSRHAIIFFFYKTTSTYVNIE